MRKKNKVMLDMREMFSRLIIERSINSYGETVVWVRWGGADKPIIEATHDEARAIADAILQVLPNALGHRRCAHEQDKD